MKKFIQTIKGFFAKPNVMLFVCFCSKGVAVFKNLFSKKKIIKDDAYYERKYPTNYAQEIFNAENNIRTNERTIEGLIYDRDVRIAKYLNGEIKRYEDANSFLKDNIKRWNKILDDKKETVTEDMICKCWSCEFALSKGWFPATLTEEQNNEVRKYGIEMGLLKLDAVG